MFFNHGQSFNLLFIQKGFLHKCDIINLNNIINIIHIQLCSKVCITLVNMIKKGCENKSALLSLWIFHFFPPPFCMFNECVQ